MLSIPDKHFQLLTWRSRYEVGSRIVTKRMLQNFTPSALLLDPRAPDKIVFPVFFFSAFIATWNPIELFCNFKLINGSQGDVWTIWISSSWLPLKLIYDTLLNSSVSIDLLLPGGWRSRSSKIWSPSGSCPVHMGQFITGIRTIIRPSNQWYCWYKQVTEIMISISFLGQHSASLLFWQPIVDISLFIITSHTIAKTTDWMIYSSIWVAWISI